MRKGANEMKQITLPDGTLIPQLGQGTWYLGDDPGKRAAECEALKTGISCGMILIDSAEMYGEGKAESLVGEVVPQFPRESLFLVSKVYPFNAGRDHIFQSCEASIKRMEADYLDLYLLHWRGAIPLSETVACMEELVKQGKIRRWGVSNFDMDDMEELFRVKNGDHCAVNQVLYHLGSRGGEFDLLPWLKAQGIPLMAYCPLAQGGSLRRELLQNETVKLIAESRGITPIQVLLAFVLNQENVFAIPKAGTAAHVRENAAAAGIVLTAEEKKVLDQAFPSPNRKTYLDIM